MSDRSLSEPIYPDLRDRVAIITGAASGLGLATAWRLVSEGAKVALFDVTHGPLDEAVAQLRAAGAYVAGYLVDVRDMSQVEDACRKVVDELGPIAIVINNAGIRIAKSFAECSLEDWEQTMGVNATGPFIVTKAALPYLREAGDAAVVNVSSVGGEIGLEDRVAYCASKGALTAMTRALAVDLGPQGIRVNAVAPGMMRTGMSQHDTERARVMREALPSKRVGDVSEMAAVIVFLASKQSSYIQGTLLAVDGGMLAGMVAGNQVAAVRG